MSDTRGPFPLSWACAEIERAPTAAAADEKFVLAVKGCFEHWRADDSYDYMEAELLGLVFESVLALCATHERARARLGHEEVIE